jgi:beta-alanine degradation protein BauB
VVAIAAATSKADTFVARIFTTSRIEVTPYDDPVEYGRRTRDEGSHHDQGEAMSDPVQTNPDLYHVLFENDRVRVLEYLDHPGDQTTPHSHPDSVMVTLSSFRRRLTSGGNGVEVELPASEARWLDAQEHSGTNIGDTDTHAIFVELKESAPVTADAPTLGPR